MNRFIIFISIVLTIYTLLNITAYRWLRFMFRPTGWTAGIFITLFCLIALLQPLGYYLLSGRPNRLAVAVMQGGHIWLGFLFYFFLLGIITGLLLRLIKLASRFGVSGLNPDAFRGGFPLTGAIIVGTLVILAGFGMSIARRPVVRTFDVALNHVMGDRDPLTIVQLSDIHLDQLRSVEWWESIVDRTIDLKPDIIVLTGDIIDEDSDHLDDFKPGLRRLSAPHGVYAVTGNHEFFVDTVKGVAMMEDCGINVLRNEVCVIPDIACLVGIDDPTGIRAANLSSPDFSKLAREISADLPIIVLNHQPVYLTEIQELGAHLQLSGHTHNGQIWPFGLFTRLAFRYNYGYYRLGNLHLYVSSGTGVWGPPFRIGTVSEIAVFRLITSV